MSRIQKTIGDNGEKQAKSHLSGIGIEMLEKIGTPVKLSKILGHWHPKAFIVNFGEQVSGDHRGIMPGGRSVLVEVKSYWDGNLQYSKLRPHQPDRLRKHAEWGGLSLLVWVHHSGIYVMEFPIEGFEKGKSLTPQRAAEVSEITVDRIRHEVRIQQKSSLYETPTTANI